VKIRQTINIVPRNAVAIVAALLFLVPQTGFCAGASDLHSLLNQSPVQARHSSANQPLKPVAIPLASVVTQAATDGAYIAGINPLGPTDSSVQEVERLFPVLSVLIDKEIPELPGRLNRRVSLAALQSLETVWQTRELQLITWQDALTLRADDLQKEMNRIAAIRETWALTLITARAGKAPLQIMQQINSIQAAIRKAIPVLEARRSSVLVIQEYVATQLTRCETALALISESQKSAVGHILDPDTPPFWGMTFADAEDGGIMTAIRAFLDGNRSDYQTYFSVTSKKLLHLVTLFMSVAIGALFLRRRIRSWAGEREFPHNTALFEAPVIIALAASLFTGSSPWSSSPHSVRMLLSILAIIPLLFLVRNLINRQHMPVLYMMGLLFALDNARSMIVGLPSVEQVLLMAEAAAGIGVLLWWRRSAGSAPDDIVHESPIPVAQCLARWLSGFVILVQFAGFVAVCLGYLLLGRLLISTVLVGSSLALTLFVFVGILDGIIAVVFVSWPLSRLRMIIEFGSLLEKRVHTLLIWVACLVWFERTLNYLGLLNPLYQIVRSVLSARLVRPSFSISLGDAVSCALTLWLAFMLATFISFVLKNEVFPRTRMSAGVSYAVSSLLRYSLIVIGVVVALGELGLSVSRVTIIFSAFGVGIGFGLQNIVNNFVSGLILLFERPIHVGDTIEFGSVTGDVWQIGIRSSKVKTFSGADIIVPNSQLVADQVTNWTLSDRRRRIDLPVGLNYGANPHAVIALLQDVAKKNPGVLPSPAPYCLLTGYGDSSINFELRAWTIHSNDWFQIRSDLAVAVYDAVQSADMSFPFPQREVRLLRDPDPIPAETVVDVAEK